MTFTATLEAPAQRPMFVGHKPLAAHRTESPRLGIYLDVGHLRAVCYDLGVRLNLPRLIARLSAGFADVPVTYYDCAPVVEPNASPAARAEYLRHRDELDAARRLPGLRIRLGELIRVTDAHTGARRWQQKGVDTRLAIDLARDSDELSDIVLVGNDLDHAPGVQEARANGARVHLWAGQRLNHRLAARCTSAHSLTTADLAGA